MFNYEFWWEAHEALEPLWIAAGRRSDTGLFIQGLIQIAVAHLKELQDLDDTAKRMAWRGLEKIHHPHQIVLGIDVNTFRTSVQRHFTIKGSAPVKIELIGGVRHSVQSD